MYKIIDDIFFKYDRYYYKQLSDRRNSINLIEYFIIN